MEDLGLGRGHTSEAPCSPAALQSAGLGGPGAAPGQESQSRCSVGTLDPGLLGPRDLPSLRSGGQAG